MQYYSSKCWQKWSKSLFEATCAFRKMCIYLISKAVNLFFVLFTFGQLLFVVLPLEPDPHHRPLRPWECCHCCLSCCQVGQRVQMDLRKSQRNLRRQKAEVNRAVWKKKKGSFSKGAVDSHWQGSLYTLQPLTIEWKWNETARGDIKGGQGGTWPPTKFLNQWKQVHLQRTTKVCVSFSWCCHGTFASYCNTFKDGTLHCLIEDTCLLFSRTAFLLDSFCSAFERPACLLLPPGFWLVAAFC